MLELKSGKGSEFFHLRMGYLKYNLDRQYVLHILRSNLSSTNYRVTLAIHLPVLQFPTIKWEQRERASSLALKTPVSHIRAPRAITCSQLQPLATQILAGSHPGSGDGSCHPLESRFESPALGWLWPQSCPDTVGSLFFLKEVCMYVHMYVRVCVCVCKLHLPAMS